LTNHHAFHLFALRWCEKEEVIR